MARAKPQILALFALLLLSVATATGCAPGASPPGSPEQVWGRRGLSDGRLQKPRAMAISPDGLLYIVDMTGRIQAFTTEGEFVRSWRTPEVAAGKPSGLSFSNDGNLLVADTHYFRMLVYTPEGTMLKERTIGGTHGHRGGEFGFVTDAVQDSQGNYYIAEYGEYDRIQKFSPQGEFLLQWGGHGPEPGQFVRPQNMVIDDEDRLWVADACNHRIQVFDTKTEPPELVAIWGEHGDQPGQLRYPYDLVLDGRGHLYVVEFGNHRVQKFAIDQTTLIGTSEGCWGASGREEGCFFNPWSLALDEDGALHVLDTYNHRVQTIRL